MTMSDAEFDADQLCRLERAIDGMREHLRIIDTGRPGRIDAPRYRLSPTAIGDLATAGDNSQ